MERPSPASRALARARRWYGRFERPVSSLSLVGGFVFDALTLTRVDMFWENFWVVGHLAIVTLTAIWINLLPNSGRDEANPEKLHFWLVNVMQFFFGGILSVYLVFYFRSGTLAESWPFLAILALAFVMNESLKRHYERLAFQIGLLFLSFYAFAIYLLPMLLHRIGTDVFLLSGLASLGAILAVVLVIAAFSRGRFSGRNGHAVFAVIAVIIALVNGLYFLKVIPPLPLSLKDAGIYESFTVNGPGRYTAGYEDQGPFAFLARRTTVRIAPGEPLYAYTAIFSPTAFAADVIHEWQYYDASRGAWITRGRIPLAVAGGADGGWRTFSVEPAPDAGLWRVNIMTPNGQVIGRIDFEVVFATSTPALLVREIN